MDQQKYDEIKHSFGMWMYESLMDVKHVTHYNLSEIGIDQLKRSEIIQMGLAIFDKRVDLEFRRKEIKCQTKS